MNVGGGYSGNIRFADNRISTAGGVSTATLNIQSSFGPEARRDVDERFQRRGARARGAPVRGAGQACARRSGIDAACSDRSSTRTSTSYFDSTANLGPEGRAEAARVAIDRVQGGGRSQGRGLSHHRHRRRRRWQQQGTVRLPVGNVGQLHAHRAHHRRHRLGLGGRRPSGLVAARREGVAQTRDREGAAVAQSGRRSSRAATP